MRILRGRVLSFSADPAEAGTAAMTFDRGWRGRHSQRPRRSRRRSARGSFPCAARRGDRRSLRLSDSSGIHRRPHSLSADAGHWLVRRATARLAPQLHLCRRAEVRGSPHCAAVASFFLDELFRCGTTTAMVYCTVHPQSVDAFFAEAERRGARMIAGKVMMDRDAPANSWTLPNAATTRASALIDRWRGRGRLAYAITPRFAVTSTRGSTGGGRSARAGIPGRLRPDASRRKPCRDRRRRGAASRRLRAISTSTIAPACLGRARYSAIASISRTSEVAAMAATRSVAAFCPTSNLFLGSGLFDQARLTRGGVPGSRSPPTLAAARAIRCCGLRPRATRCCNSTASPGPRSTRSTA